METFAGAGTTQTAADGTYDLVVNTDASGGRPVYLGFGDPSGEYAGEYYDHGDGSYDLSPLPPGTYRLDFDAPRRYRGEYWPNARAFAHVRNVVVPAGATVSRKNARLSTNWHVANLNRPAITHRPKVGRKVTARAGRWDPSDVKLSYQWLVAGKPVARATHASYKPRSRDAGKTLRVRVTAASVGMKSRTVTSPARRVAPRR
jgi:hypothetical protein